tara:strand:+ start:638 stop:1090 length:453 start_codon:yes stop_codon:yes gene_type:complete
MNNQDTVALTGQLTISINGEVVKTVKNLVVTAGKNWVASRMNAAGDGVMTHMAIGTGTTAAAVGQTTLVTEVARVALTTSGGSVSNNVLTYTATIPADTPNVTAPATAAITEAAVLNAASSGTMLCRTVFTAVNKGELDTMTISWTVTIS